jgi:hypothetical protein
MSLLEASRLLGLRAVWPLAKQCSFYKDSTEGFRSIDFGSLSNFPITTKNDLRRHPEAFCPKNTFPDYVQFSGGKSGSPAVLFSSADWIPEAYERFDQSARSGLPRPILLKSEGASQGSAPLAPGKVGAISLAFRSRENYKVAAELIRRKYTFQGFEDHISLLTLPLPTIKKLIHFNVENDCDLENAMITTVYCFGFFLSRKWRDKIESFWNCEVVNVYGITELRAAHAVSCRECGFLHFDDKVVAEVVDVRSSKRISAGIGRLLLTTLASNYYVSPVLIRYDTDDIVEIGPFCRAGGESGISVRGRASHLLTEHPSGCSWLVLTPADVLEQLDADPVVARVEPSRVAGITSNSDDAPPKWNWKLERNGTHLCVKLFVELKFSPNLFPEYRDNWRCTITKELLKIIASRAPNDTVDVDVHCCGPGLLEESSIIF